MVHSLPAVSIDTMRDKLITLDKARERLGETEPISQHTFPSNNGVAFRLHDGWHGVNESDLTEAWMRTTGAESGGTVMQLTKKAVLEAGAQGGIPREYAQRIPAGLLESQLNWWFQTGFGDKEFKLLTRGGMTDEQKAAASASGIGTGGDSVVLAMCRGSIQPYSNLALLDRITDRIRNAYGTDAEVLVDYKFHHDLERTNARLIVPGASRTITGTRQADDTWSAGIDFRNFLTGLHQTDIQGYLFRWWCTNGATDNLASSGAFSRRGSGADDEVYTWAANAVDEVLGGLESAFDSVQQLTEVPVEGDVSVILRDLFRQFSVPRREQQAVLATMGDLGGDLSMYDIQQAVTQAANAEGLSPRSVDALLAMGGHTMHAATGRCNECRRLLPEGYVPPEPVSQD